MAAWSGVTETWASSDPVAAGEWIDQMEPGGPKDAAITGLVSELGQSHRSAAVAWARQMGSEEDRMTLLFGLYERSRPEAREALMEAIERSDLVMAERQHLVNALAPLDAR